MGNSLVVHRLTDPRGNETSDGIGGIPGPQKRGTRGTQLLCFVEITFIFLLRRCLPALPLCRKRSQLLIHCGLRLRGGLGAVARRPARRQTQLLN